MGSSSKKRKARPHAAADEDPQQQQSKAAAPATKRYAHQHTDVAPTGRGSVAATAPGRIARE